MSTKFQPLAYAKYLQACACYAEEGRLLYEWNGVHWAALEHFEVERRALDWLVRNQEEFASASNADAAVKTAMLRVGPLPTSRHDMIVPCQNVYVMLDGTGLKIVPPSLEYGMKYAIKCRFDAEAPPPKKFTSFLEEVLPDRDVRERLQEYFGYSLTNDTRHQRAQMWLGSGANGKGVLANTLQALHGKVASVGLHQLDGFKLSALIGASLIYVDEAPSQGIDEHLLKSLIAGEAVSVDRKYRDPVTVRFSGKWVVLGNHPPKIRDHSDGFWRRWDIVPFDVQIPPHRRDATLAKAIIDEELPGVLNWALEGLLRLHSRGMFNPVLPAPMERMLGATKAATSSVRGWVDDLGVCVASGGRVIKKDAVYDNFKQWVAGNGAAKIESSKFWIEVKNIFPAIEDCRPTISGKQVRYVNLSVPGLPSIYRQSRA